MQSAEIEKLTTLIDFYGESENEYSIFQYYCEIMGQHQSMDNVYAGLENLRVTVHGCLGFTITPSGQKGTMFGQRPNTQATIYARSLTLRSLAPGNTKVVPGIVSMAPGARILVPSSRI
jgi:hypothetical protein